MKSLSWLRIFQIVSIVLIVSVLWLQIALPSLLNNPAFSDIEVPIPAKFVKYFNDATEGHSNYQYELTAEDIIEIQDQIMLHSQNETLLNEEIFGPVQADTIVIIVQVHNRLNYLRNLIVSLAQARYIEKVLIIFSHDFHDQSINNLITSIDFCKVLQIFYPFSLQAHPRSYPGESYNDCKRDTTTVQKSETNCIGNPDIYGHYREARYVQTKLHWWWKANKVFDLWVLRNHTGLVLFLEEDHYVAEDFLYMLFLYEKILPKACPKCSVITLGNYLKSYSFVTEASKVEVGQWVSPKHNMGFAFNHTVWEQIKECTEMFCKHDDYNWDWSLQQVSLKCLPKKVFTFVPRCPRVFHIGDCGVHHKKKDCSSKLVLNKVRRALYAAQKYLFPNELTVIQTVAKKGKVHKGNGGWGDARDHLLCTSFIADTSPLNPVAATLIPDPVDALNQWNKNNSFKFQNV